jgi:hypothetical protein
VEWVTRFLAKPACMFTCGSTGWGAVFAGMLLGGKGHSCTAFGAHPTGATGAEVEAPAQAPPAQSDAVANTAVLEGLHAAGADAGDAVLQGSSAGQLLQEEGSSAAAAAGLKPVQE